MKNVNEMIAESVAAYREKFPRRGTVFVHHSGRRYVTDRITNQLTLTDPDPGRALKFPVSISYYIEGQEMNEDAWFTRSLDSFLQSFKPA